MQKKVTTSPIRRTGQVKWLNDDKGFGFIRDLDSNKDTFVHIRDLRPKTSVMPTLYTGEYVQFSLAPNGADESGNERFKAVDVTGIRDRHLMCDMGQISFKSYSRVVFEE